MPHNFQGVHHKILNVWEISVCLIIRCWFHAKFASGRLMTIWALKQNGRTVWRNMQYLAIWYHMDNLLHFDKPCFLKLKETRS